MLRIPKRLQWHTTQSTKPTTSKLKAPTITHNPLPSPTRPSFCLSRLRPTTSNSLSLNTNRWDQKEMFSTTRVVDGNFAFKLHDIGEGIAEVELVKWFVKEGDRVEEFDTLCEVQSDKSTVELTSPTVGIIRRLGADEGIVVKVGEVICDIEVEGEGGSETAPEPEVTDIRKEEKSITPPQTTSTRTEPAEELGPRHEESLHRPRDDILDSSSGAQFSGEAAMLPSPPPSSSLHSTSETAHGQETKRTERIPWSEMRKIVKASPAVRTLAARMGVDLANMKGSGEGGRVLKDDIIAASTAFNLGSVAGSRGDRMGQMDRDEVPAVTRVEFGRTRKVMYRALGEMGAVPHFGYSHTLNLTPILPYLRALTPSPPPKQSYLANDIPPNLVRNPLALDDGDKTTILSFLIKGLLLAMEHHPIMRSRVKQAKNGEGERWLEVGRDGVVGVAVSDPKFGLLTPSLPPLPPSTPLSSITSHLNHLRHNASKATQPGHLTISSVGALGESRGAMPVLPPGGGLAICAVGRARWEMEPRLGNRAGRGKKVWDYTPEEIGNGGMEAVLRCPVGWSGDHRVLEGAELIAFTETWKMYIEEPWRWLKLN